MKTNCIGYFMALALACTAYFLNAAMNYVWQESPSPGPPYDSWDTAATKIQDTVPSDFLYVTNGGTITITDYIGPGGDVVIPDTITGLPVTSIGVGAFERDSSMVSITIPDSVTTIENFGFNLCSSLTNVTMGNGVTNIGWWAFSWCTELVSVAIPDSVLTIGPYAFSSCTNLTSLTIGQNVIRIESCAFRLCGSLTNVILPDGVTGIGSGAFASCSSLTSIRIPDSVIYIGNEVFVDCTNLGSVTLGKGLTRIGHSWFDGCSALTNITVDPLNSVYSSVDGVWFNKSQTTLIQFPVGRAGSYRIPNSVTTVEFDAFAGSRNLDSVTLGNRVKSIGDQAFYACTSLTNITFTDSVASIERLAFGNCHYLTSVTLGNGVTNIAILAFYSCTSLTTVTVPDSVARIGDSAFRGCTDLTAIFFKGNTPYLVGDPFGDCTAILYYLPGAAGWGPNFGGRPTALWHLPYPVFLDFPPAFGVQDHQFGFRISWATNVDVVIESSMDLVDGTWSPVSTNTLTMGVDPATDGWSYFSDLDWTNYPARFYRIRSLQ